VCAALTTITAATWLEMKSRGYWLTSADKLIVESRNTIDHFIEPTNSNRPMYLCYSHCLGRLDGTK